jgi:hypothetical protein
MYEYINKEKKNKTLEFLEGEECCHSPAAAGAPTLGPRVVNNNTN